MDTLHVFAIDRLRMLTDGEGVTTLVCSYGCPLRCAYCLNPASWDGSPRNDKVLTVEELYNELRIDDLYFLSTGGGVMFGGGEPLINADFIAQFIEKYEDTGWKFYMETSLAVPWEQLLKVADRIDGFFVDSKDMNKARYEKYTLGDYELFFSNLMKLKDRVGQDKIIVRVPEIPDFHHGKTEADENEAILRKYGFEHIDRFKYILPEKRKKISTAAMDNKNRLFAEGK